MSIIDTVDLITTALWPQGDIRDPLGVWGFRKGITGDGAGVVKVTARAAAGQAAAYIYTCYSAQIAVLTGATADSQLKIRLLTNWPNIDPQEGIQAYSTLRKVELLSDTASTAPISGPNQVMVTPLDRFILLFDPRPSAGALDIVELELDRNVVAETYSFEGYGYYWDRSVLNAPGGPRHPGAA